MSGINRRAGFTIVELLIVIVVIGILAAITIVAFNGVQDRGRVSAAKSELQSNAKSILSSDTMIASGSPPLAAEVASSTKPLLKFGKGTYSMVMYCANTTDFILAAKIKASGAVYYVKNTQAAVQNDSLTLAYPSTCTTLGVTSPVTSYYYGARTTACAGENATCTFADGPAAIMYGSVAQGKFTGLRDMTSPVTCSNTVFTDPASGFSKQCFVIDI